MPGSSSSVLPARDDVTAPDSSRAAIWVDRVVVIAVVALGVVLRFVARSSLWLDEALTVNIAHLPLRDIGPWLRHDGHPPLYYWLLHGWMSVFGTSDVAVRSLSGVCGLVLLPLVWLAARRLGGRRAGWAALAIAAVTPYAVRYSTETRMYALVMVLVLALWLVGTDALERPAWPRLGAVTVLSAALLWTHYWAMWLLGAVGILLLVRLVAARRRDDHTVAASTSKVIGALVVGGVLFVPWVGNLLYQSAHTGTPWARPSVPTDVVATSVADIGGGAKGDNLVLGWSLVILVLLGLFGVAVDRRRIELDVRTRTEARAPALIIVGTLVVAVAGMYVTDSAFATRYDAVWVPLFLVLAALGVTRFGGPAIRRGVLACILALGVVGSVRTAATRSRTEAHVAAQAIVAAGKPGDLVVTCPDQLGPSLRRELPGTFAIATFPELGDGRFVDWVDYQARVDVASPRSFVDAVLRRAGDHAVFLAWASTYRTHQGVCEQVVNALASRRPGVRSIVADDGGYFEHEAVLRYPVPTG